jgi:O-acetyl-ADP-ribose deacetylase (regulator of RNase III)
VIRVIHGSPTEALSEAVLRSVSSNLEPDTAFSRTVELLAGKGVSDRLQNMGELPVGAAVITPGGDLDAAFLIHVVLQSSEEPVRIESLRSALQNGLRRAQEWGLESLAIPPLGTGAGNLDVEESANETVSIIRQHFEEFDHPREVTILVATAFEEGVFKGVVERSGPQASARES